MSGASAHATEALGVGTQVLGFEVEAVVDTNSLTHTYRARGRGLRADAPERLVALRELLPRELAAHMVSAEHVAFAGLAKRFLEEGQRLAALRHDGVVDTQLHRRVDAPDMLVMEWVDGMSLRAHFERPGVAVPALVQSLLGLLPALNASHASGLLHANLNPDTVWVRTHGGPVLTGFGAAQQAYLRDLQEPLIGLAAGYAAPEQYQYRHARIGPWSDVYGFAALLYRCATGLRPVDALQRVLGLADGVDPQRSALDAAPAGALPPELLRGIDLALSIDAQARPPDLPSLARCLKGDWAPAPAVTATDGARAAPGVSVEPPPLHDPLRAADTADGPVAVRASPAWLPGLTMTLLVMTTVLFLWLGQTALNGWMQMRAGTGTERTPLQGVAGETLALLLSEAETAEAAGQYLDPAGENAVDGFLAALNIDPANDRALLGLERIIGLLKAEAALAIGQRDRSRAGRATAQALRIVKGALGEKRLQLGTRLWLQSELQNLSDRHASAEAVYDTSATGTRRVLPATHTGRMGARVTRLFHEARAAVDSGDETLARYKLKTVLSLRPEHADARALLAKL
ncbi:MAG: hypothetical protein AAF458_16055 [Pseudomonadota bacterium]